MIGSEPWGEIFLFKRESPSHIGHDRPFDIRAEEIKICRDVDFFKKEGIDNILIDGPNVLDYEKIADLIEYLKKSGFFVRIISKGSKLRSPLLLDRLGKSGLDELEILLSETRSGVHDFVTGSKGDFEESVSAVKKMKKRRFPVKVGVHCPITKNNKRIFSDLADLAIDLKPDRITVSASRLETTGDDFNVPEKDLGKYLRPIHIRSLEKRGKIRFFGIPFCVFGRADLKKMNNMIVFAPGQKRTKKKTEMCDDCAMFNHCSGFNVDGLSKFSAGKLKPLNS